MSDAATLDAPVDVQSVQASSQAAINAARFVVALFESLWESDQGQVEEIDIRSLAIEYGLVVDTPNPSGDENTAFPELSDDLLAFVETMSEGDDDTN
jgi:hypothetical protein